MERSYTIGPPSICVSTILIEPAHVIFNEQGFTVDGHLNGLDEEEDYVDKCVFVEGQDAPTDLPIAGTTVESSLIGFHVSDMYIHNCGYVGCAEAAKSQTVVKRYKTLHS